VRIRFMLSIVVQVLPPSCSEKTADFDRDVNNVRVIRVKGNALRMRLMGRAGKVHFSTPGTCANQEAPSSSFPSRRCNISGPVASRHRLSAYPNQLAGERINFLIADALISFLPAFARVAAGKILPL
jgi:hypothetical protein